MASILHAGRLSLFPHVLFRTLMLAKRIRQMQAGYIANYPCLTVHQDLVLHSCQLPGTHADGRGSSGKS
jgi:hypothetical protein